MSQPRYNPRTQRDEWYYRIKESFRDLTGRVRSRIMLNVGFINEPHRPEDIRDIGKCLTYMHEHQGEADLFGNPLSHYNEFVQRKAKEFWQEMVNNGSVDAVKTTLEESREKAERLVDVNTVKHTDAREIGAEWVCLQAIRELEIDKFLQNEGWGEIQINTTLAHLITRTIYSPSELKSMRIMDENSAVCELISGNQEWHPGFQSIYKVASSLYELKNKLESHLCQKTDNLFNITNRIAIFDLTNFYFEGRKDSSKKAQFGRSKEKRSDCKLLVLGLCINREDVIRYSSILAGNTADPNSLPDMVDTLNAKTRVPTFDEKTTWDYYNLTREIEYTNRQLKTDLNLRSIHHKKDDRSDAHLFLGLLSYWIVNTIRYRLKQTGETCYWTEIVRRLSTQKAVTTEATEATNALGEKVHMRLCSEPNKSAEDIYERLKYKKMPFRKIKIKKNL